MLTPDWTDEKAGRRVLDMISALPAHLHADILARGRKEKQSWASAMAEGRLCNCDKDDVIAVRFDATGTTGAIGFCTTCQGIRAFGFKIDGAGQCVGIGASARKMAEFLDADTRSR